MTYKCKSPVLFLVFNRPDVTRQVFEAIRAAQPSKLFVAADGPRMDREGEVRLCQEVRTIATNVDWDCKVMTFFRDENVGCGLAVSSSISWFFENEPEGIILEDDCLPNRSFFQFCDEMLERYRDDARIMHIGGANPINQIERSSSYSVSKYNRIWGWACWASAWNSFDLRIQNWPKVKRRKLLFSIFGKEEVHFWSNIFDRCHQGYIDTWDYQWFFSRLLKGWAIIPGCNLIQNIGFGEDATHTLDKFSELGQMKTQELDFPLADPCSFLPDFEHDSRWSQIIIPNRMNRYVSFIKRKFIKLKSTIKSEN